MIDIAKQIDYWKRSGEEDLSAAEHLIRQKIVRHALFFGHLALEKILKAHVCKRTQDMAPKIHNLKRLAEIAELVLTPEQQDVLAEMNAFNLRGRYPEFQLPLPRIKQAQERLRESKELFLWLHQKL